MVEPPLATETKIMLRSKITAIDPTVSGIKLPMKVGDELESVYGRFGDGFRLLRSQYDGQPLLVDNGRYR